MEVCKLAGVNVSSSARAFAEEKKVENLPLLDSGVKIDEFLFSGNDALSVLISYCKAVAKEEISTAHFAECLGSDLDANFLNFI